MNAIAKHGDIDSAAEVSIRAGVDLLLVCKSLERSEAVYRKLIDAKRPNRLGEERLAESIARILKMKRQYALRPSDTKRKISTVGWPNHRKVAEKIRQFAESC